MSYAEFLARKQKSAPTYGEHITAADVHERLHDWQREIVAWAVRTGRAAIWADTGLGKTLMQVEWARLSGDTALIVAPLAVCTQTVREAATVGVKAAYVRDPAQMDGPGMYVTNYEMVERFDADLFDAVVLDEASILKQSDGKTRTKLIAHFSETPRRLACTATPAPNDIEELTNQAEFLGRSTRVNMLAAYFVHDSDTGWRLKGHAHAPMFKWMTSWAVALRRPSDIGYSDEGYDLPGLEILPHLLPVDITPDDQLFATDLGGVGGRAAIRKQTLKARVEEAVRITRDCGSQGIHASVLRGEPLEMGSDPRVERRAERKASSEVSGERGSSSEGAGVGEGLSRGEAIAAQSVDLRTDAGRDRDDDGSGLRDLRGEPEHLAIGADAHRPRSRDGHGPWCSVPVVQSGIGTSARRPDQSDVDAGLPHACSDQWLIWCGLNDEQDALEKAFGDECVSIRGATPLERKMELEQQWREGKVRILVTKPEVFMFGMNWQHCARMAFVGLSDSYESYYQAIRRCYRYGQTRVVQAHVVLSDLEGQIAVNIARKEREASSITAGLVAEMRAAGELTREDISA